MAVYRTLSRRDFITQANPAVHARVFELEEGTCRLLLQPDREVRRHALGGAQAVILPDPVLTVFSEVELEDDLGLRGSGRPIFASASFPQFPVSPLQAGLLAGSAVGGGQLLLSLAKRDDAGRLKASRREFLWKTAVGAAALSPVLEHPLAALADGKSSEASTAAAARNFLAGTNEHLLPYHYLATRRLESLLMAQKVSTILAMVGKETGVRRPEVAQFVPAVSEGSLVKALSLKVDERIREIADLTAAVPRMRRHIADIARLEPRGTANVWAVKVLKDPHLARLDPD